MVKLFCETGSVNQFRKNDRKTKIGEKAETFAAIANSRQIASQCDLFVESVGKILKRKFHPYHICLHQSLDSNNFKNKQRVCE